MSYCNQCGNQIKDGQRFCTNCGAAPSPKIPVAQAPNSTPVVEKKQGPMISKGAKIGIISTVVVGILLFAGYTVMENRLSPQLVIDQFMEAVKAEDVKTVKNFINNGQNELQADDAQTKIFIKYLQSEKGLLSDVEDQLAKDGAKFESKSTPASFFEEEEEVALVNLKKSSKKKWFLFNDYNINVNPFYLDVSPSSADAEIFIENKKVGKVGDDEETFGPFLPGEYELKGVFKGEFGTVEEKQKISYADAEDEYVDIEFDLSEYYVALYSNYDDAILYVNGKSTGKVVGEIDEMGPIPMDGSIKVYAEKKFDTATKKSEEVVLKDTDEADLSIEYFENTFTQNDDSNSTSANGSNDETAQVEAAIRKHYGNISNDDFAGAHALFSAARKTKVPLDGYANGLKENLKNEVLEVEVESIQGNTAVAYFEMISYDQKSDGSTVAKKWGGKWTLVKENDQWTLDDPTISELN